MYYTHRIIERVGYRLRRAAFHPGKVRLTQEGDKMKLAATKIVFWCLMVWMIAFGAFGGATASSDFAVKQTGAIICPANTTPGTTTYTVMATGSDGITRPSRQYILQCKDANGAVIMENDTNFMFLWVGIVTGLAFILAAPIVLIALLVVWMSKTN
jgi:hypothetical protein